MRLSRQQIAGNEAKIRAAMSRLLNGDIPPGGKCDIKTLAGNRASTAPPSTAAAPTPTCAPAPEPPHRAARHPRSGQGPAASGRRASTRSTAS